MVIYFAFCKPFKFFLLNTVSAKFLQIANSENCRFVFIYEIIALTGGELWHHIKDADGLN